MLVVLPKCFYTIHIVRGAMRQEYGYFLQNSIFKIKWRERERKERHYVRSWLSYILATRRCVCRFSIRQGPRTQGKVPCLLVYAMVSSSTSPSNYHRVAIRSNYEHHKSGIYLFKWGQGGWRGRVQMNFYKCAVFLFNASSEFFLYFL